MKRDAQKAALASCASALAREIHHLPEADLGAYPQILWQQLYNRLQWTKEPDPTPSVLNEFLKRERTRRAATGRAWLRSLTPLRESSAMVRTLVAHSGETSCCAYSRDGGLFVSGGSDGVVKLWNMARNVETASMGGGSAWVTSCDASPDGNWVIAGYTNGTLTRWDVKRKAASWSIRADFGFTACGYTPSGDLIATGGGSGALKLWDLNGSLVRAFEAHIGSIRCLAFSPDGAWVVTGGDDSMLKVWDPHTGRLIGTLGSKHAQYEADDAIVCCAVTFDGKRIASGGVDGTLRLWAWEVSGASLPLGILRPAGGFVQACAFSPRGNRIVMGSRVSREITVSDVRGPRYVSTLQGPAEGTTCCAYSPDGSQVATGSADGTVRLWDVEQMENQNAPFGHEDIATCCAYSPRGDLVVTGSHDGTVRTWDALTGLALAVSPDSREPWSQPGLNRWVWCCTFSPDGNRILFGERDGLLTLWDLVRGAIVSSIQADDENEGTHCCEFSGDGSIILTGGSDVRIRNSDTLAALTTLEPHGKRQPWCCAFSPDGSRAAVGYGDGTLVVWRLGKVSRSGWRRPRTAAVIQADGDGVWGCAWSPTGDRLVTGGGNGRLFLWDVSDGCLRLGSLEGHTARISGCAYSADGTLIASASDDGTLRLWTSQTGRQLSIFLAASPVTACDFGPSSGDLCCTDQAGNVYILHLEDNG